jgi:hypothetical protein
VSKEVLKAVSKFLEIVEEQHQSVLATIRNQQVLS